MKQKILLTLLAFNMTIVGPALAATDQASHSHEHSNAAPTQQLNAGQKWETDAALRQSMSNIRQAMTAALQQIHENRLPTKDYDRLAKKVESEVGNIVANCKLAPAADAQLHLIVADLLEGAEQMAGKNKAVKRQHGAVGIIGALEKYATYFDDAGFKPITH
ncbi:MAG: hypothetical protein CVU16_14735 [Betaproteobacteria bacterium HGW-Betaproteobacteria-10]|jgi:hypothetical protein|nr:MAG: hypothetical protein CVU16_14735 [Betaproteobacteria bacterium HGW-Betaproteobacteria-10]